MKKTLLITDVPPCTNLTGGLVLADLIKFYSEDEIACFAILDKDLKVELSPELSWLPIRYHKRPNENGGYLLGGKFGVLSSIICECYNEIVKVPYIVKSVIDYIREFGAERIWCVLEGQTMIHVASAIAYRSNIPLFVQVWDPLEWWLRAHKVNHFSSHRLVNKFAEIMQQCDGCFAASNFMADCYQKAYGVRAVSFIPCLKKEFAYPPAEKIHSNSELVFVMAGQLYAIDEWNAFIDALELLRWEIYGKAVSIILLGSHAYLELPEWASCHVVKTGWRSQEDVLAICNNADFLYCPYWFSHDYEQEARLGFPAKLTTYMASGRPIIFHGPRYSSPARFIESHHAGFICDTINVNDICNILKKIVSNTAEYAPIARNATTAFYKNMTTEVLHKKFIDLFGQHN